MTGVHGDAEAIRQLARRIADFAQQTLEGVNGVAGNLSEMASSSWQDRKQAEFSAQFDQLADTIRRAVEEMATGHVRHLEALAARLDEYTRE